MAERRAVLLTVSGRIPATLVADVADGVRPRADYIVLAAAFDADLVDVEIAEAANRLAPVVHRLGGAGLLLAWHCFRRRHDYEVIVTDGEQVGIPLALLCRLFGRGRARHAMIVHILSVPKKQQLIRIARLAHLIDRYVVYSSSQAAFVEQRLGVARDHIVLTTFMVDTAFFAPTAVSVERRPMICSAGLERRDYPTLMAAVAGLDVEVIIAAASPWSKRADTTDGRTLPGNVTVERLSLSELRDVYAASKFVVMPLEETDFQAGITTILEAMSMGRAVLCSRTSGQSDTVTDGVTGRYVQPGDAAALRSAIIDLLNDQYAADEMGERGRAWAVAQADVERYAARLAAVVRDLQGEAVR
jgi:glycosyltransferase involved in cell wall biosynthesis